MSGWSKPQARGSRLSATSPMGARRSIRNPSFTLPPEAANPAETDGLVTIDGVSSDSDDDDWNAAVRGCEVTVKMVQDSDAADRRRASSAPKGQQGHEKHLPRRRRILSKPDETLSRRRELTFDILEDDDTDSDKTSESLVSGDDSPRVHMSKEALPSLAAAIESLDVANDDAYNDILCSIEEQRAKASTKSRIQPPSKSLSRSESNWSTARQSTSEQPRRRLLSQLGAARIASSSGRVCALENVVVAAHGAAHMHEFLEKKKADLTQTLAEWDEQLCRLTERKAALFAELEAAHQTNLEEYERLQAQGSKELMAAVDGILAGIKEVATVANEAVHTPGAVLPDVYCRSERDSSGFLVVDDDGAESPRSKLSGRSGVIQAQGRLGRSTSVGGWMENRARQLCTSDPSRSSDTNSPRIRVPDLTASHVSTATLQRADDIISCSLASLEAVKSTYCMSDLLTEDGASRFYPFTEMEQSIDGLEKVTASVLKENAHMKAARAYATTTCSSMAKIKEDLDDMAPRFKSFLETPDKKVAGELLRASRGVKVTSSLMGVACDLRATFPASSDGISGDIEWGVTDGHTTIKAASIDALLGVVLTQPDAAHPYFEAVRRTFCLTFRYYSSVEQLLEKLVLRYCFSPAHAIPSALAKPQYASLDSARAQVQLPERDSLMSLLAYWVDVYYRMDFYQQPGHLSMLTNFLDNTAARCGNASEAAAIRVLLMRKEQACIAQEAKSEQSTGGSRSRTGSSKDEGAGLSSFGEEMGALEALVILNIRDISPRVLAEQLTLLEADTYAAIKPHELLHQAWNKEDKARRSPALVRGFRHFNAVSALLISSILAEAELEERAKVLRHVVLVGLHLLRLNNYNGVMEVVSALQSSAVARLWATWNLLGKNLFAVQELLCILGSKQMAYFRLQWKQTETPSVPYVGIFLTDLTFLEDGNPTWTGDMVNMFKFQKIERTISDLLQHQETAGDYALEADPPVRAFLRGIIDAPSTANEERWYDMSVALESREANANVEKFEITFDFPSAKHAVRALMSLKNHPLMWDEDAALVIDDGSFVVRPGAISPRPDDGGKRRAKAGDQAVFSKADLDEIVGRMRLPGLGVTRRERQWRSKVYEDAFLGTDAVDWLVAHVPQLQSRSAAAKMGKALMHAHLIRHVTNDHSFRDKQHIYQFVEPSALPSA